MARRAATISRKTNETNIEVTVNIDGKGASEIKTGIGFFDHMLEQLSRHSLIDITLKAQGDLHIDTHHTVEDCGWALGAAFSEAMGLRKGICRYATISLPMDEALTRASIDVSGRPFLVWRVQLGASIANMDSEVFREFFQAFSQGSGITLHIENLYGENNHHIIESSFKAVARALRMAVSIDEREGEQIPSTKGVLGGSL